MTPRLLVTAGASREYFDAVRFLSNASTGAMGLAVATAAVHRGWDVLLLLGPGTLSVPEEVPTQRFESARDLDRLTRERWPKVDAFVATAAVADYRPEVRVDGKRKKGAAEWPVTLVRNPDVLANRGAEKGGRCLVGFALETSLDLAEARRKLEAKNADLIVLNTIEALAARGADYVWVEKDGPVRELPSLSKVELATEIVDFVEGRLVARDH